MPLYLSEADVAAVLDPAAAVEAIEGGYALHARRAREIAADHFAAEKVLASLMERAGL